MDSARPAALEPLDEAGECGDPARDRWGLRLGAEVAQLLLEAGDLPVGRVDAGLHVADRDVLGRDPAEGGEARDRLLHVTDRDPEAQRRVALAAGDADGDGARMSAEPARDRECLLRRGGELVRVVDAEPEVGVVVLEPGGARGDRDVAGGGVLRERERPLRRAPPHGLAVLDDPLRRVPAGDDGRGGDGQHGRDGDDERAAPGDAAPRWRAGRCELEHALAQLGRRGGASAAKLVEEVRLRHGLRSSPRVFAGPG